MKLTVSTQASRSRGSWIAPERGVAAAPGRRLDLYAPAILLWEFANTIWKEVRRSVEVRYLIALSPVSGEQPGHQAQEDL